MYFQDNEIFQKDLSQKKKKKLFALFALEEKFPLSLGTVKKERISPDKFSHLVTFYLDLVKKKCLVSLPQLTNVFSICSTLHYFWKSAQVPSKLFFVVSSVHKKKQQQQTKNREFSVYEK